MLDLTEIVPEEYINNSKFANRLASNKLLRHKMFSKFLKDVNKISKESKKILKCQLEVDLNIFEKNKSLFAIKAYEQECLKYGVAILDSYEIIEILNMLYFRHTFFDIFVLQHISSYCTILRSKREIEHIHDIVKLGEEIFSKIVDVCKNKGLNDFLEKNYLIKLKELHILDSYIKLVST